MDMVEKHCITKLLKERYRRGSKGERGRILAEVCVVLGVGRRQARRYFEPETPGRPKKIGQRGRPSKYQDAAFVKALRGVWKETQYMCSRHLKSAMPEWIGFIELEQGAYEQSVRERLLSISPPTIDRILKPWKAKKGISLTRPGSFRDQIPIQENLWDVRIPGYMEVDTVAHCGGSILGEYVHTITMVDIASTWTEVRAVFGKGSTGIVKSVEDIENSLPFELLGYDSDNGTEVLNQHIIRYFRTEREERNRKPVLVTRSRAYRKNDNAHVEQRNNSINRRWLGYERLDFSQITPLVDFYFRSIICPLMNHFFPSFKLLDKRRYKSRTHRIYAEPQTPYSRLMNSDAISDERKDILRAQHTALNPLALLRHQKHYQHQIDKAIKLLRLGQPATGLLEVPSRADSPSPFQRLIHTQPLPLRKILNA